MAYKKPILQAAAEENGWKEFKGENGAMLPDSTDTLTEKTEMFKYPGGWCKAFYKGDDPKTSDQWIIVTNNGGFYKIGASYMVWSPDGRARACWSAKTMKIAVCAFLKGEDAPRDPDYQT